MLHLQASLKNASYLARIQHIINDIRDYKPIQDKDWLLRLLNISSSEEDAGTITYLLLEENKHSAQFLLDFSNKIHSKQELDSNDWDVIYSALFSYRSHLLAQNYKCKCC